MAKIKAGTNGSKKDVIAIKAAELFRRKGFASSSMRELADSIGVEASSLYNHIGSKNELLQLICFKVAAGFNKHLEEVKGSELNSVKKIENLIRFHIRMVLENYDEVFVANHEWKHLPDPYLNSFLAERKRYENSFIELITSGIKTQELKNVHPYVAALTILSAIRGIEFWHRHKKNVNVKNLEDGMVEQLLNGLSI